jgi:diacylglycerol kinase
VSNPTSLGPRRPESTSQLAAPTAFPRQPHSWPRKFRCALRGIKRAVRSEVSFFVHFFFTALVIAAGIVLRVSRLEWCLLILCIGLVLTAEMLNTALEWMVRAMTDQYKSELHDALDMGSGGVLLASITAVLVGLVIFVHRLGVLLDWWPAG